MTDNGLPRRMTSEYAVIRTNFGYVHKPTFGYLPDLGE
jgi:hypothetical protein